MKNGTCPKCQSNAVYITPSASGPYRQVISISFFKSVEYTRYLCLDCGFSEEWIAPEDLKDVRECAANHGWPKANDQPSHP